MNILAGSGVPSGMNADTASELRTVQARVTRITLGVATIYGPRDARLAVVHRHRAAGGGHTYDAVVYTPDGAPMTPRYATFDDAVCAALAPHLAAVRGECEWSFPETGRITEGRVAA